MRFQIQMLLAAAVCAVLFHGASSAPSQMDLSADLERTADDSEDADNNPLLILAAKYLVKQVGCAIAVQHAQKCGYRQLSDPLMDRVPEEELDQGVADILKKFGCSAAKFISKFC